MALNPQDNRSLVRHSSKVHNSEPVIRDLGEPDLAAAIELDATAFGYDPTPEEVDQLAMPLLRQGRVIGSYDGEELIGLAVILDKNLTFPGGVASPAAAVTWVGVRPGAQRRGVLRSLMTHQLHGLHHEQREPVAILTASEAGIYGRFGYGMAAHGAEVTVPAGGAFRPGITVEQVREVDRNAAWPTVMAVYQRVSATRTGYLSRDQRTWDALYSDLESIRRGAGSLRFAIHPDGFVAFRMRMNFNERGPNYTLSVHELCAATPAATAALWHHLLNRALVREVNHGRFGTDEVLKELLVDPRAVISRWTDHLWLRIVDLERTIPLRRYSSRATIRVAISDDLCPWNAGTWEFALRPYGGQATRTDADAEMSIDIADLAAAFLGSSRIIRLAAAGLVIGDPAAIGALDRALSTPRGAYCPEGF